ncbi:MAG: diacylglycerol kinase family lipid kinase [Lachnospiraceae bacterium]|nr:diacylglycerol kinase family lipid kinase [Lachnospiraceae bacterium]
MKKMLFVYNPKSGKGQIRFSLSRIIERFSAADYDVTVYPTKAARDAAQTTCTRAADYDIVVCCGGDGTLDEVVTGLMMSGVHRPIGYIPAGSTNDFAGSIGIPRQMERAAETVINGELFQCDIGRFNGQDYFVYVAAFGLLTDVSYQTKQELKNVLGHAAYIIEGVKRLGSWKSWSLQIESEECSCSGDFVYGMVSNSNSVGGFKGLPGKNIELNDGLFEVMLVRTPVDLFDWQKTIGALLVNDENNENIIRFKTHHLTVRSEEPVAWTRDGEDGGEHLCVELENMPRVLGIMAGGQLDSSEMAVTAEEPLAEAMEAQAQEREMDAVTGSMEEKQPQTLETDSDVEQRRLSDAADKDRG